MSEIRHDQGGAYEYMTSDQLHTALSKMIFPTAPVRVAAVLIRDLVQVYMDNSMRLKSMEKRLTQHENCCQNCTCEKAKAKNAQV